MRRIWFVAAWLCVLVGVAFADEGMWLYNSFPKEAVKSKYGFEPTQAWLDHLRLSSVRFNNGGSGSFVSPDGLTFTNHHVGAECVQQLSTGGKDFMKTGFYAASRAEEVKCPNLELNQLVGIEDVTTKVNAGLTPGMSATDVGKSQRQSMSKVENDCAKATGLRCDVITFYSGEVFHLYKYKKYTDVRLVFAPEFEMAFFGGDPDNFTYPRYDLDVTFFRVYENDKPAHTENYLPWSRKGVKEGDLVFVSGHPGSTGRLLTIAEVEFLRDVEYPDRLANYKRRINLLQKFGAESEENARIAKEWLFTYQNSQKAIGGYLAGLDAAAVAHKTAEEQQLRADFKADPKSVIGDDPWEEISKAVKAHRQIYLPMTYVERLRGLSGDLAPRARMLVRAAAEKTRPNEQRLREFRESNLASLEQELFSTAPIYKSFETVVLADSLAQMQEALGNDNPVVQKALGEKTPADAAKDLIASTRVDDVSFRKQLYEGGAAAIEASTDPLIVLMRNIDPDARQIRKQFEDEVESVKRRDGAQIARVRFAKRGFTEPPDATFTLRLSYGAVRSYEENSKKIPCYTMMGGAYQHAAENGNKPPYQLPESWMKAKPKLNLKTPFNFVSTPDIIGGSSGSPTVNKAGELVGILFDGNIPSLAWNFVYNDTQARAVSVDARGIQEALRKVYGAAGLADELMGKASKAP